MTTARHALPRRPALDGLRALAVIAVVLYHVDPTIVPGGFVGVDVFFVLSGYLITTLLLAEHDATGGVSLVDFWRRRIRRLWPLAWLTLAVVAVASLAGVWTADRQRTLPAELAAALGQVANWFQVGHGGYVDAFTAPSPVRHFWSLAVEEQFYVLWPLLLVGLLAVTVQHRRRVVPAALLALGAASVAAGFLAASPDRAYLGTDARFVALVAGAALAWAWRAHPFAGPERTWHRRTVAVWAAVAAVALLVACAALTAESSLLPHGGFAMVALAAAGIVAAAVTTGPAVAVLSAAPLVFVGRLSFALYLCHWPLLVAMGPGRPLWLRLVVALPVALAVAWLMHRLVERPVMERRLGTRPVALAATGLVAVAVTGLVLAAPTGPTASEAVAGGFRRVSDPHPATVADATLECPAATVPAPAAGDTFAATSGFDPHTVGSVADPAAAPTVGAEAGCRPPARVLVVGDSTGRGASNGLVAARDPRIAVWDRTVLGCSLGDEDCPDWHELWARAVAEVHPDVVLVYANVVSDLHGVDDPPFLSDAGRTTRVAQLVDAAHLLSAGGARVLFTTPAPPRAPDGLFFCGGRARDSNCDPRWVDRWNESVRDAATAAGAGVVDVRSWVEARGSTVADRPDGDHLSGPALLDNARWLVPQILAAAPTRGS